MFAAYSPMLVLVVTVIASDLLSGEKHAAVGHRRGQHQSPLDARRDVSEHESRRGTEQPRPVCLRVDARSTQPVERRGDSAIDGMLLRCVSRHHRPVGRERHARQGLGIHEIRNHLGRRQIR
jgi:hypothetical protein